MIIVVRRPPHCKRGQNSNLVLRFGLQTLLSSPPLLRRHRRVIKVNLLTDWIWSQTSNLGRRRLRSARSLGFPADFLSRSKFRLGQRKTAAAAAANCKRTFSPDAGQRDFLVRPRPSVCSSVYLYLVDLLFAEIDKSILLSSP